MTGNVDMTHTANNAPQAPASAHPDLVPDGNGGFSMVADPQPYWDDCSTRDAVAMSGKNVGDYLNTAGLSWGFFQGGFRPTTPFAQAAPGQPTAQFTPDQFKGKYSVPNASNQGLCNAVHPVGAGLSAPLTPGTGQYGYKDDYIAHHQPFQYYASTANPHHLTLPANGDGTVPVSALQTIGTDTQHYTGSTPQFDTPNHQYDMSDFDQLVAAIHAGKLPPSALPAVNFLKAPGYQDGHAGYSDPLDEQRFVVDEINALQQTPDWQNTAVVVAYDDSDGWYDHAYSGVHNPSQSTADALTGPGQCGTGTGLAGQAGRCGYAERQPLLVISPWAKTNYIDHTLTDQSSILKFVEDNWLGGRRIEGSFDNAAGSLGNMFDFRHPRAGTLTLDPTTGTPVSSREPGNGGGRDENADRQARARTEGESTTG
jgi:phospholipase C